MNTQGKLGISDVLRLFRLGLLPAWMWEQWRPHHSMNAADKAPSFHVMDIRQRVMFWFTAISIMVLVGFDVTPGLLAACLYVAAAIGAVIWLHSLSHLVHWAWNVATFYKISRLRLVDMLSLDRDKAKGLAHKLLVEQAWRTLGTQRDEPTDTKSRQEFGRIYQVLSRLMLTNPASGWKPYFDQGEEILKARGWRGGVWTGVPEKVSYEGGLGGD